MYLARGVLSNIPCETEFTGCHYGVIGNSKNPEFVGCTWRAVYCLIEFAGCCDGVSGDFKNPEFVGCT